MAERIRTIRLQKLDEQGSADDLQNTTPAERLEMLWQLALNAWAFTGKRVAEQRLPRDVVRVLRGEG
ncbi:MAG: hypothetical protein HY231_25660 [Acidobacteria bacterium]|nr:hypothetical protein [Acidobacteriota bacterium]